MQNLSLPVYDLSGATVGNVTLDADIFGIAENPTLLHQVLTAFTANRRQSIAHTKDRSDVAGSGKKPWRQKGTGNARVGSTRSPLWRGGGVTFGPSNARNFQQRLPQKMRQGAFRSVLSDKVRHEKLIILTSLDTLEPKTKQWLTVASKLPQAELGKLVVTSGRQDAIERAIRNLPHSKYTSLEALTIYDAIRYPVLVMTQEALEALSSRLKQSVAKPQLVAARHEAQKEATV